LRNTLRLIFAVLQRIAISLELANWLSLSMRTSQFPALPFNPLMKSMRCVSGLSLSLGSSSLTRPLSPAICAVERAFVAGRGALGSLLFWTAQIQQLKALRGVDLHLLPLAPTVLVAHHDICHALSWLKAVRWTLMICILGVSTCMLLPWARHLNYTQLELSQSDKMLPLCIPRRLVSSKISPSWEAAGSWAGQTLLQSYFIRNCGRSML